MQPNALNAAVQVVKMATQSLTAVTPESMRDLIPDHFDPMNNLLSFEVGPVL